MTEENSAPVEAPEAVTEVEENSGSVHFDIGDLPPGVEAVDSEPAATDEESGGVTDGEVLPGEAPQSNFFSFKTADGKTKDFTSQEEAQQFFSSWNGRLSKAERELNDVTSLNYQWQEAYRTGQLTPAQERQVESATKDAVEATVENPEALGKTEWQTINRLLKEGEGEKALQYIQYKNSEYLKNEVGRIEQSVEQRFADLQAPVQFQKDVSESMSYVASAGQAAVDDMGQPMFPEFQDGATYDRDFVMHFRNIWLAQDYRLATDPNGAGFKSAYYEAKHSFVPKAKPAEGAEGVASDFIAQSPGQAVAAGMQNAPRNADGTFAKRNAALSMSGNAGGTPAAPGTSARGKGTDILSGMRDAGTSRNSHFAVAPD